MLRALVFAVMCSKRYIRYTTRRRGDGWIDLAMLSGVIALNGA